MPFKSLGLRAEIAAAVDKAGYVEPTPIQKEAIPEILRGHDLVGIAQTGTGKTAAFVLPMLQQMSSAGHAHSLRSLVVVPTRELAVQVETNVKKYGINLKLRYATIYGGVGENPQIDKLRAGVDLVIATPGRLVDLMERGFVDFRKLELLVLDEADRMLDMGFLPSIRRIVEALPRERQTLLFSATFSKEIEATAAEFLRNLKTVEVSRRASPADTVDQSVIIVAREQKVDMLLQLLEDPAFESVLVFTRTKHGADKVARKLQQRGLSTATLHSNRSQAQRLDALNRFKAGEVRVLVATDIAARGIDVHGISHVINLDFPPFPEDYVHRIGRTGRAQAVGDAVSFVMPEEMQTLRAVEKFIGRGIPRKEMTPLEVTTSAASQSRDDRPRGPRHPAAVERGLAAWKRAESNDRREESRGPRRDYERPANPRTVPKREFDRSAPRRDFERPSDSRGPYERPAGRSSAPKREFDRSAPRRDFERPGGPRPEERSRFEDRRGPAPYRGASSRPDAQRNDARGARPSTRQPLPESERHQPQRRDERPDARSRFARPAAPSSFRGRNEGPRRDNRSGPPKPGKPRRGR